MQKFDSITHFLQTEDFDYRVFDMGRKITPISNDDFQKIEDQAEVYPFPFLQKSWVALLFWPNNAQEEVAESEAVIWFLQFPIDEMGFLKQESRDGFLIGLLEQVGKNIYAKQKGGRILDELNESPFAFKPQPNRLASFHALATVILGQSPSQYYQHACDYLRGDAGFEQWQFLGLQGVADVVARLDQSDNKALLVNAVALMPQEPLESFCGMLENIEPDGSLTEKLVKRLNQELDSIGESREGKRESKVRLIAMLVRALSGALPDVTRQGALLHVLESLAANEIEVLAAISGRAWNDLYSKAIMDVFIANLANQDQAAFNAILMDLMMIPKMRQAVMEVVRNPERPDELSCKLSEFMKVIGAKP